MSKLDDAREAARTRPDSWLAKWYRKNGGEGIMAALKEALRPTGVVEVHEPLAEPKGLKAAMEHEHKPKKKSLFRRKNGGSA